MILVVFVSIAVFLLIYGVTPLCVTNDAWIMAGYDEADLIQHYAGWVMFRASEWKFPLGMITDMAVGTGTMLTFTDSIPLVAIVFKLVERWLPETFQYFGWYMLACFVLQGIAAYKIVSRKLILSGIKGDDLRTYVLRGCSALLLGLTPILLERSFRHTALGSQWLILFAILCFLKGRDAMRRGEEKLPRGYVILNILTVLIHPYFLPMVMVFTLLTVFEYSLRFREWVRYAGYLILNMVLAYGGGWLIGALGWGVDSARYGYGYFSLNLNALVNPQSLGGYRWSVFLPELGQVGGNYDGFNYLGMGMLFLIAVVILVTLIKKRDTWAIRNFFQSNWQVLIAFAFLTVFAISNIVTLNDKTLLEIAIPEWLYWKCGIFRASARLFYPVYYCLFIIVIYYVIANLNIKWASAVLIAGLLLQLTDMSAVIVQKHTMMLENSNYESILDQKDFEELAQGHTKIVGVEFWDVAEQRRIAVWAGKHNMSTSYTVANSGTYPEADALAQEEIAALEQGNPVRSVIYATQDVEQFKKWKQCLDDNSYHTYYYNEVYYIIL
jgi:hypothetical protein